MCRYHTEEERCEKVEKLHLLMTLKRLRCLSLDRRVEAAQYISNVSMQMATYNPNPVKYEWMTPDHLGEWMKANGVLYTLFGPSDEMLYRNKTLIAGFIRIYYGEKDGYLPLDVRNMIKMWHNEQPDTTIMKQSVDVLKFACAHDTLQFDHVKILWNIIERVTVNHAEEEDLSGICDVMIDALQYLDLVSMELLIAKIRKLDLLSITPDHLKVISAAIKSTHAPDIGEQCFTMLWDMVQDETKANDALKATPKDKTTIDICKLDVMMSCNQSKLPYFISQFFLF
eukprot:192198_1